MTRDGWWWEDQPPRSAVGILRVHGLVFIGKVPIGGRNCKAAVVPEDLRNWLTHWVQALGPSEEREQQPGVRGATHDGRIHPGGGGRDVYEEVRSHYEEQIDWEPDIKREWVEDFLKAKEVEGSSPEKLSALWSDINAFMSYQDRTEYGDLAQIPYWQYSLALEWLADHVSDFRLNLRNARRLLTNLLDFYGFLRARGIVSDTAQLEKALVEICGGKRLQLVERIPYTGEELWCGVITHDGTEMTFKMSDFWLIILFHGLGGSWERLRAAAQGVPSGGEKLELIRALESKVRACGYDSPLQLVCRDIFYEDLEDAEEWFYGTAKDRG